MVRGGLVVALSLLFVGGCSLLLGGDLSGSGDDADPADASSSSADGGALEGHLRGPCTKDGKCLEGLVCIQDVCLRSEETDGSVPEPDGSTGADAAKDGCPYEPTTTVGLECPPGTCSGAGNICCAGPTSFSCTTAQACEDNGGERYDCNGPALCASGKCCVRLAPDTAGACPWRAGDFGGSNCTPTECADAEYRVCRQTADCPPTFECHAVVVQRGSQSLRIGICL